MSKRGLRDGAGNVEHEVLDQARMCNDRWYGIQES